MHAASRLPPASSRSSSPDADGSRLRPGSWSSASPLPSSWPSRSGSPPSDVLGRVARAQGTPSVLRRRPATSPLHRTRPRSACWPLAVVAIRRRVLAVRLGPGGHRLGGWDADRAPSPTSASWRRRTSKAVRGTERAAGHDWGVRGAGCQRHSPGPDGSGDRRVDGRVQAAGAGERTGSAAGTRAASTRKSVPGRRCRTSSSGGGETPTAERIDATLSALSPYDLRQVAPIDPKTGEVGGTGADLVRDPGAVAGGPAGADRRIRAEIGTPGDRRAAGGG